MICAGSTTTITSPSTARPRSRLPRMSPPASLLIIGMCCGSAMPTISRASRRRSRSSARRKTGRRSSFSIVTSAPALHTRSIPPQPTANPSRAAANVRLVSWASKGDTSSDTQNQIYRIDHFLGKETVQNIMALRFANGLFEPLWSRQHIDHVQITAAETVGVEHRGKFYEKTGALRDMVPNHVFQLLAMTAMEPPISFDADAVRSKKAEVIQAMHPIDPAHAVTTAVRGQYDAGTVLGKQVRAYRHESDVAPDSTTETFVACKLKIDNWRWAGVPFYLRTGKYLKRRSTEIAIRFRQAPYTLFRGTCVERMNPNWMILRIQPDEGIAFEFAAKLPGPSVKLSNVSMDFAYKTYFKMAPNTGYETLLYDCMIGDATLFQRADNIEAGWQAVQPILDAWANNSPRDFPNYVAGSDGPSAADELLTRDGRAWRPLD